MAFVERVIYMCNYTRRYNAHISAIDHGPCRRVNFVLEHIPATPSITPTIPRRTNRCYRRVRVYEEIIISSDLTANISDSKYVDRVIRDL